MILLFLLISSNIFCQTEANSKNQQLPASIYTSNLNLHDINSSFNLHEKLNLKNVHFMYVNFSTIDNNHFSIPFQNLKKVSDWYLIETYQDIYNTQNLKKSFYKVSNLYYPQIIQD